MSNCSYEDFLYVQRVGVAAPYFLALSFKDYFSGAGAIVNISSTRAFQSQANTESYTAAKGEKYGKLFRKTRIAVSYSAG